MKNLQKIVFLSLLLFATTIIITAQALTSSHSGRVGDGIVGMTVFDSNSFYAADNAINVQNGFAILLNNADSVVLGVYNSTPPPQLVANKGLNRLKIICKQPRLVVAEPQKSKEKNASPTLITWGNSPYGNNSIFAGANFCVGIISTTNYKLKIANYLLANSALCYFAEGEIAFEYSKQLFQTHETISLSNNYSKTSRIRPPPPHC